MWVHRASDSLSRPGADFPAKRLGTFAKPSVSSLVAAEAKNSMRVAVKQTKRLLTHRAAILLAVATFLHFPHAYALASSKCRLHESDQVSPALASLSALASKSTYRRDEPIPVTLTLHAGTKGVYLPAFFGEFNETCEHGFTAILLTMLSKAAAPHPRGCAMDRLGSPPGPNAAQEELHNYTLLAPGATRTWKTTLATAGVNRGLYCLYSEYLSFGYLIDEVARLPEVEGRMAKGRITAPPVLINIR